MNGPRELISCSVHQICQKDENCSKREDQSQIPALTSIAVHLVHNFSFLGRSRYCLSLGKKRGEGEGRQCEVVFIRGETNH